LPKLTETGVTVRLGVLFSPLPVKLTEAGAEEAFELTLRVAVEFPRDVGVNVNV
jgi:hypothetical protein